MSSYPYKQLNLPNETRILMIQPGNFEDEIVCSLTHMPLGSQKAQSYKALSYCWAKSINVEVTPPDDAVIQYMYGSGDGESGQILLRDMLDHPVLHRQYINFGGLLPSGTITCDGVEVTIGGELHRAIKRIRSNGASLRIWIDALCIDQSNIDERNKHVLMMGDIFAGASSVKIWLGEDTGLEQLALGVLSDLSEIGQEAFADGEFGQLSQMEIQKRFAMHPKSSEIEWEALEMLFRRAWFRRIWVVQEVANSKDATVHIGDMEIGWEWLTSILSFAFQIKSRAPIQKAALKPILVMRYLRGNKPTAESQEAMSLLDILEETRLFESTLASDKIYAMLPLALESDGVVVDYSLEPEQVFMHLAVELLNKKQSLDILCHCMLHASPSKLNLPSWVPDWTVQGWVEPFRSRKLNTNAAGDSQIRLSIDENNRKLSIWGKVLGKIEALESTTTISVSPGRQTDLPKPPYGINKMPMDTAGDLETSSLQTANAEERNASLFNHGREEARNTLYDIHSVASPSGTPTQEIRTAMARTFACNRSRDGSKLDDDSLLGLNVHTMITCADETVEGVFRWIVNEATGGDEFTEEGAAYKQRAMKAYQAFVGPHFRWCYHRRFFRAEDGNLGWAVNGTQVGDVIALFYGADYPFVLREDENGQYRIVGDCYFDQHMDGEGLGDAYPEKMFDII